MSSPPLAKINSPTAAGICQEFEPQPESRQLLTPTQTPHEYLQTLQEHNQSEDSIKLLAHGMPERESTWWAAQSARKVADPGNAADQAAIKAADAWVKNPSPATREQAAAAAAKTDYQTSGAWAAQAAAWAQPQPPAAAPGVPVALQLPLPSAPGAPVAPRLTPHAVSGAVMLAAAQTATKVPSVPPAPAAPMMPAAPKIQAPVFQKPALPDFKAPKLAAPEKPVLPPTPQQKAATAKIHEPFIKLGTDIASGRNSWV
jgi:hypothetical protein